MINRPDLSIVIGSYNNQDFTLNALRSVYKYTKDLNFEIILIDDASLDDVYEKVKKEFPKIYLQRNKKNLRYSKTYNIGTMLAKGRYILHMNADALFTKQTKIVDLIEYMDQHIDVGMLGNRVLDYYNGELDPDNRHQIPTLANSIGQSLGLYKIFPNIKSINYYMTYLKADETAEVGGIGAFMLFRREIIKDVGLLDEKFKIYCQDSDFCYRVIKKGWKIIYYPESTLIHIGGGSNKRFDLKTQIIFHEDLWRFYKKNLRKVYPEAAKYVILAGLFFRFFVFLSFEIVHNLRINFKQTKISLN